MMATCVEAFGFVYSIDSFETIDALPKVLNLNQLFSHFQLSSDSFVSSGRILPFAALNLPKQ